MVHKVEIVGDIQELIDTQWDVNSKMDVQITDRMIELIDTQWDVNRLEKSVRNRANRINRYIVGCKQLLCCRYMHELHELIDTQWDVNVNQPDMNQVLHIGINRYIVGCK